MGSQDQNIKELAEDNMAHISFPELIAKKRDGRKLSEKEIKVFVDGVTNKTMQESQIGAMLMAIFMKSMSDDEISYLTMNMMKSGVILDWPSDWDGLIVDKHSTGGVGDKISLPLAPALAACGLKNPMISGRGLGFTGGTLDKLESIPGYNVYHSAESMLTILNKVGCCIVGQTDALVPADKKLYATRDVTGTVESIPLIAASIISKKGAEGLNSLVLDVKTGSGAMLTDERDARDLAQKMVMVGKSLGMKMTAILTDMSRPTGYMIGNALEISETIDCLRGGGPADTRDLTEVEGGYLLYNVGKAPTPAEGARMIGQTLDDGTALAKFCEMLKAQGVSDEHADILCSKDGDVFSVIPKSLYNTEIPALSTGYVSNVDAKICAVVSYWLGAGRTKADEPVDPSVGLQLHVTLGSHLKQGETWATIHHNKKLPEEYIIKLQQALTLSLTALENVKKSLIKDII